MMGELAKARKQLKGDGRRLGSGSVSVVGARCSHVSDSSRLSLSKRAHQLSCDQTSAKLTVKL